MASHRLMRLHRVFTSHNETVSTIEVGKSWSLKRRFTKQEVFAFSELSGDKNAVHLDEKAASESMFKRPIVHGMLVGSLFSNILGNNVPGSIYLKQSLKFVKPVYYEDDIKAVLTVVSTIPDKKRITLDTKVYKDDGTIVIEGEAFVWVNNEKIKVI